MKMELENGSIGSADLGNTKTKSVRPPMGKHWCFTYFPKEDQKDLMDHTFECLRMYGPKGVLGREVCPTTGKVHFQGYIQTEQRVRPSEKFREILPGAHWEKARGSVEENLKYCTKEGSFLLWGMSPPLVVLAESQLYDWQKDIVRIISTPADDRTIHWYWEPTGNIGKTTFAKYLAHKHGAIPLEGKKNDILYCAAMFDSSIYLWDLERSMEEYVSYAALEKIKNGFYMCSKYESKPIVRACPHVIVFANFEPDYSQLSADRWRVTRLGGPAAAGCTPDLVF